MENNPPLLKNRKSLKIKNIAKQHCEAPELLILEKSFIRYMTSGTDIRFNQHGLTNLYSMNLLGVKYLPPYQFVLPVVRTWTRSKSSNLWFNALVWRMVSGKSIKETKSSSNVLLVQKAQTLWITLTFWLKEDFKQLETHTHTHPKTFFIIYNYTNNYSLSQYQKKQLYLT